MRLALRLAKRAYGLTSPNPLVGAVLVKRGRILGQGWHHRAGAPHAEIEAIRAAVANGHDLHGATLYVTLEPCCTFGRTPPCVEAITLSGITRVVVGATDPNPKHAGRAYELLRQTNIKVTPGVLAEECDCLNEAFNYWIVQRTPFVTVKAAMTLDGKIATVTGESKWITGEKARAWGMKLRQGADAILVGVNTILADNPSLTARKLGKTLLPPFASGEKVLLSSALSSIRMEERGKTLANCRGDEHAEHVTKCLRRIILDSSARTPLDSRVISDRWKGLTTVVVARNASKRRVMKLSQNVAVWVAPTRRGGIDLNWLLRKLGSENVTSLLVEGGGEVNASFLLPRLAHRIAFFYGPKIVGGVAARRAVAGHGANGWNEVRNLREVRWQRLGADLLLTARVS